MEKQNRRDGEKGASGSATILDAADFHGNSNFSRGKYHLKIAGKSNAL